MYLIVNLVGGPERPDHHVVFHAFAEGLARILIRRRPGAARVRAVDR